MMAVLPSCVSSTARDDIALSITSICQGDNAVKVQLLIENKRNFGRQIDVAEHTFTPVVFTKKGEAISWSPKEVAMQSDPAPQVFFRPKNIRLSPNASTQVCLVWPLLVQRDLQKMGNAYLASYGRPPRHDISIGGALALDPNPFTYPPQALLLIPGQRYNFSVEHSSFGGKFSQTTSPARELIAKDQKP